MAWNKSLSNWGTTIYATQFWSNIANNKDKISDAHLKAFSALKDNPTCIEARQHDPGLDPYCNMDWLNSTENNNGCHLPLPDLSESQETHLPLTIIVPLPAPLAAQSVEAIRQFANSPEMDVSYTGANSAPYAYLYEFKSGNSHFTVNNITGRVQFAQWMEVESKDQKEVVDIDQGQKIAELFAREKYPEFWNVSNARGIKDISKDMAKTLQGEFLYRGEEVQSTPDKSITTLGEIPGLNGIEVDVSPYTGHVIGYREDYTPSVITGTPPVNLTPHITEEQAKKIAEDYFRTLHGEPDTTVTGPELLNLKISNDKNNLPHLEWNFEMIRIQVMGPPDDTFEYKDRVIVSIDAHDGTVLGSFISDG